MAGTFQVALSEVMAEVGEAEKDAYDSHESEGSPAREGGTAARSNAATGRAECRNCITKKHFLIYILSCCKAYENDGIASRLVICIAA